MKKPGFLYVDTDLWKLNIDQNVLCWVWSKMAGSQEVGCISRRN